MKDMKVDGIDTRVGLDSSRVLGREYDVKNLSILNFQNV